MLTIGERVSTFRTGQGHILVQIQPQATIIGGPSIMCELPRAAKGRMNSLTASTGERRPLEFCNCYVRIKKLNTFLI